MGPLRAALFDWGGTLAASHRRLEFLHGDAGAQLAVLHRDAIPVLLALRKRGIPAVVVTNTSHAPELFLAALARSPIRGLIAFVVQSSEPDMCAKPCGAIFRKALDAMNLRPQDVVFVGNSFEADVVGASRLGIPAGWVRDGDLALALAQALRQREQMGL